LASREEDSGRKNQTSWGERDDRLDRFRVRLFPLSFFCIFSFKIAPLVQVLKTPIYRQIYC
jgi:hypothetical protein